MANKLIGVYRIWHVASGDSYVGSSIDITHRVSQNFSRLKHKRHGNKRFQRAFDVFGRDAFSHEVLELCSENDLLRCEGKHMRIVNTDLNENGTALVEVRKLPNRKPFYANENDLSDFMWAS